LSVSLLGLSSNEVESLKLESYSRALEEQILIDALVRMKITKNQSVFQ